MQNRRRSQSRIDPELAEEFLSSFPIRVSSLRRSHSKLSLRLLASPNSISHFQRVFICHFPKERQKACLKAKVCSQPIFSKVLIESEWEICFGLTRGVTALNAATFRIQTLQLQSRQKRREWTKRAALLQRYAARTSSIVVG